MARVSLAGGLGGFAGALTPLRCDGETWHLWGGVVVAAEPQFRVELLFPRHAAARQHAVGRIRLFLPVPSHNGRGDEVGREPPRVPLLEEAQGTPKAASASLACPIMASEGRRAAHAQRCWSEPQDPCELGGGQPWP